jgi:CRISPR-associated endonuclease/helicase Cas3
MMISSAWAKLSEFTTGERRWHSLVGHGTDVAAVLEALLAVPTIRKRLAAAAAMNIDRTTADRLCVLAFLHDLGKANLGFWCKQLSKTEARSRFGVEHAGHIRETATLFCDPSIASKAAEALDFDAVKTWGDGVRPLLFAMLAHHGRPVGEQIESSTSSSRFLRLWQPISSYDPLRELEALGHAARAAYPAAFASDGVPLPSASRFAHLFAGLLSLADWIGSNPDTDWFPLADGNDGDRLTFARERARTVLGRLGIDTSARTLRTEPDNRPFTELFGGRSPFPIQRRAGDIHDEALVIFEAETGAGKTEAALWHFHRLFQAGLVDGLYFALPTRIAATQMHERVTSIAKTMFGSALPPVLAVPGYLKVGEVVGHRLPGWQTLWPDEADEQVVGARWASEHSKRFLAAPIAVGTVDQALLSGLQVGHSHLRAAVLARSLLVVDEVHASDHYMRELIRIVVRNHTTVGGRALLMSATLGSSARIGLTGSDVLPLDDAIRIPYPAVTKGRALEGVDSTGQPKKVAVDRRPVIGNAEVIATLALDAAANGATVAVVRNQVKDAVATQRALEALATPVHEALFRAKGVSTLHHGRFARSDRKLLDDEVTRQLGRDRPTAPRIIIGTQTLEQSLDIDADLLVTDLCPMDVLLQRIGRLHRHVRRRPRGFEEPRVIVLTPEHRDLSRLRARPMNGLGHWPNSEGVYGDVRIIEATLMLLERHDELQIPMMNRYLVEHATHERALADIAQTHGWEDENNRYVGKRSASRSLAHTHGLDMERPFDEKLVFPDEERVRTRLGLDDRVLRLRNPMRSPFGNEIDALNIPGWMAHNIPDEVEVEAIRIGKGIEKFEIRLDRVIFTYDRFGLSSVSEFG